MQINVETKNGVTQLAGFVTSQGMKERAGKVAAGVVGRQAGRQRAGGEAEGLASWLVASESSDQ